MDYYQKLGPKELVALARWDRDENEGRIFREWRKVHHPQLGDVEVGGLDPRIGIWNPSLRELPKVCTQQSLAFLRVAALAPSLGIDVLAVAPLGEGLCRVEVSLTNLGYLPTTILASAEPLDINEPLSIDAELDGLELIDPAQKHVVVGHLSGWGRGLHAHAAHSPRSSGTGHRAHVSYVLRGRGQLRLRAGSCRVGWTQKVIDIPSGS